MNPIIQFIADKNMLFVLGILIFFGLIETAFGYFTNSKRDKDDVLIETVNAFFLFVITKPLVVFLGMQALKLIFPHQEGALKSLPFTRSRVSPESLK